MPFNFFQYQVQTWPPVFVSETITEADWHQPWSEPLRPLIAPALAIAIATTGAVYAPQAIAELTLVSKWFAPLSEPVRTLPGLSAPLQRAFTTDAATPPVISVDIFGWNKRWLEPPAPLNGLAASRQQVLAISPTALNQREAVTESRWHQPWSEPPVKEKIGFGAHLQRTSIIDATTVFHIAGVLQGYNWWSEPRREIVGYKFYLQKTFAWEPRTIPPATVSVTISAKETSGDAFLGAMTFGATSGTTVPVSAKVSIFETGNPLGTTGVWET